MMDTVRSTGTKGGGAAGDTPALFHQPASGSDSLESSGAARRGGGLLACVDDTVLSDSVLRHALAVARGLELTVTAARVIEVPQHSGGPVDPLEWQMRRREGRTRLDCLIGMRADETGQVESVVLTGSPADELTAWAKDKCFGLMALGTHEPRNQDVGLGATAQRVLERAPSSLLLVPAHSDQPVHPYRSVMVALDGSCRAESVLPVAVRIARAHGAELILVHVLPRLEAVASQEQASALCMQLSEQNERSAREYINGLQAQLWKERLAVRAIVDTDGDPRSELRRIALKEKADLIVVSSHGRSGMSDVACGSVTEYLATHAPAPLLVVRPNFAHTFAPPKVGGAEAVQSPNLAHS